MIKEPDYRYQKGGYRYQPGGSYEEWPRMCGPMTITETEAIPETGAIRESLGCQYTRHLPLEALAAASASFEYGAKKYSDRNWERGLPWQQMIDSLKRHLEDFERGHDRDDGEGGSGLHQVCMIGASAMMLIASVVRNIGTDDRLIKVDDNALNAKDCTKWIQSELEKSKIYEKERKVNAD